MVEWYITTIILTDGVVAILDIVDFIEEFTELDLLPIAHIVIDLDLLLTVVGRYGTMAYELELTDLNTEGRIWTRI